MTGHSRRQFVRYSGGAIAVTALLAGGWWQWTRRIPAAMTPTGLGAMADQSIADMDGAGAVGAWAIEQYPHYQLPVSELASALREHLQLPAEGPLKGADFEARLQQGIQTDFARGQLIPVRDWQLSETEVLLAVLRYQAAGISTVATTQAATEQNIVEVTNWGPRSTTAGTPPNSFGEGFSALWFDVEGAPRWAEIAIDGQRLHTSYRENYVLVASFQGQPELQKKVFSEPGEHVITLHDDMHNTWQTLAVFAVTESSAAQSADSDSAPASEFCAVTNWGPRQTTAGVAQHEQSNGAMGVWIQIKCAPADTQIQAGERRLKAHISPDVITTAIPAEMFQQAGEIPLSLVSDSTGQQLSVGTLVITAQQ